MPVNDNTTDGYLAIYISQKPLNVLFTCCNVNLVLFAKQHKIHDNNAYMAPHTGFASVIPIKGHQVHAWARSAKVNFRKQFEDQRIEGTTIFA